MRPEPARGASGANVWATAGAAGCSVVVFVVILGVMAFVTRDRLTERPAGDPAPSAKVDAGAAAPAMSLSDEALFAASEPLRPALRACLTDALARDPSAGRQTRLKVRVSTTADGPTLEAASVVTAPSPFFRPCMAQRLRVPAAKGDGPRDRLLQIELRDDELRFTAP